MKDVKDLKGTWRKYQGALIPRIAPHQPINLSNAEAKDLLIKNRVHFIRWTSNFDKASSKSFWYVIKDGSSSMEELSGNTRSKIRRGLKRVEVRKLSNKEILEIGAYNVYLEANKKYNDYVEVINEQEFKDQFLLCTDDVYDFWGVFMKETNDLVAYAQNYISDNACEYSVLKFNPKHLKHYLSYALIFEMNTFYLNEKKFKYVNDGARSIGHDTNIQNFLIDKFKFRKAYCDLRIVYSKKIGLIVALLYPFRSIFYKSSNNKLKKVGVLLRQHEILKNQSKEDAV